MTYFSRYYYSYYRRRLRTKTNTNNNMTLSWLLIIKNADFYFFGLLLLFLSSFPTTALALDEVCKFIGHRT